MRTSSDRAKDRILEMKRTGELNETLIECFEKQHRGCEDNVMTHFFCGNAPYCRTGSTAAVKTAKHNMKHYYAAIGLVDKMDDYLEILRKRLPRFFPDSKRVFGNEKKSENGEYKSGISQAIKNKLKIANAADYEIYEYAKELFERQLKACKINVST